MRNCELSQMVHKEKINTKQNTKIQPKKTVHETVNFGLTKID